MFPHEKLIKIKEKNRRFLSLKREINEVKANLKAGKITNGKAAALAKNIQSKYKDILGGAK